MKVHGEKYHGAYGAARFVAYLCSAIGWLAIMAGVVAILTGIPAAQQSPIGMMILASGAFLLIAGLIQVAVSQGVRAAADSADYARQSLMLQVAQARGETEVALGQSFVRPSRPRVEPRPVTSAGSAVPPLGSLNESAFVSLDPGIARAYVRALEGEKMWQDADAMKSAWYKAHKRALIT